MMHRFSMFDLSKICLIVLASPTAGSEWYRDVSVDAGVSVEISQNAPGGGIGVGDFNRNGFPDLFFNGYFESNRLLFNNGDGSFSEDLRIADQIALPNSQCNAVAVADYDNDGWSDIFLACNAQNHLLRNIQGSGFEDITPAAVRHTGRTEAAAWADLTGNGLLDLVLGVHSTNRDPDDPEQYDRILINQGNGEFIDIAPTLEISRPISNTLAVKVGDISQNGRPDIYFVNDRRHVGNDHNVLLKNLGPGCKGWCFEDISIASGADRAAEGMGIAIADFDQDGDWDLFYSGYMEQILLQNQKSTTGQLEFIEVTESVGVNHPAIGWGTAFFDANNNGWEDLALAMTAPFSTNQDRLFINQGNGVFVDLETESGFHTLGATEGLAWLDYERNGRIDLLFHHFDQRYALYRNMVGNGYNWLGFRLEGSGPINRDAIGTVVIVTTPDGRMQMRERRAGGSRGATHDSVIHFGLGEFTEASVIIRWPDGLVEKVGALQSGQYHRRVYAAANPMIFVDQFHLAGK